MTLPITVVTLFPDMFPGPLGVSIMKRAEEKGLFALSTVQIRDFAFGKHKTVDDTPYGGGAGMVMRPDVVAAAIRHAKKGSPNAKVVYMSPSGTSFNQEKARQLASHEGGLILLCGHYEGIDDRVLQAEVDEEISIGDYVLSGGELAAMVVVDAVVRNIPESLGNANTLHEESFDIQTEAGEVLLEYPHFTRPVEWEGQTVPEVLTSGHHANIQKWRMDKAYQKTKKNRPDLLKGS
ncbi:MAG: tRNA (guanosine(37)-N1)-methyltransferase TrmD [Pseudomonadota bacterium]|nr:tRNA (guanosine(37)-N1)-methyltransferase TrmD [Magnetococcales bacterium]MEC8067490.1 tRNA (guanosine(37)-N1)-methyltransferase TrmD [Pseudomonadota bacterium]MEC8467759.1 tRNA (guanosine(37)-N1)-methyltransferase TrmD [Pseudomonadota bacterium]|tara:strand:+ start:552 stop:1259 length:708 start_codon:yes stop_codon:yes gene_type:complete